MRGLRALAPDPLVVAVLALLALVLFTTVRFPPDLAPGQTAAPPAVADAPPGRVQDFAYHFNYARWAFHRPGVSPYSYDAHREFLHVWLGPRVHSALCFAYGPALVLLWAPLFVLSTAQAWLVWNLVGATLAGWTVRALAAGNAGAWSWARLAAIGTTAFQCLVNGQTALVTTGCLAATLRAGGARPTESAVRVLACAAGIAVLAFKPPLAIVAVVALLLAGRPLAVGLGMMLAGACALLATWYWSPAIVWDYAELMGRYNLLDADEVVRAGFTPQWMTNLRSVLLRVPGVDDSRAFFTSGWAFAIAVIVPLVVIAMRGRVWPLDVAASWTIMAYLLFAPHLSSTEDVLLVVPLALLLAGERVQGRARPALIAGCVAPQWLNGAALTLVGSGSAPGFVPVVPFLFKLVAAVVVARVALRPPAD